MDEVLRLAKELSLKLQKDDCYLNYINSRNLLKQNKFLYDKMIEFKNGQLEDNIDDNYSLDREKYLSKLYSDLMLADISRDFLNYEDEFLKKYSEVIDILSEDLNIELYSLN